MITYPPLSMDLFEPVETPLLVPDAHGSMYHPKGYLIPPEYLLANLRRNREPWIQLVSEIAEKKSQRIFVPELEYTEIVPDMLRDIKRAFLGTHESTTIYAQNRGKPDCKYMAPSTGGITKSELARQYIRACLRDARKTRQVLRCPGWYKEYLKIPPPLYYAGGRHRGDYAYVDIREAHWSIHKTSTIDMRYIHGMQTATGNAPYLNTAEVTDFRELRHAIPGSLATGSMREAHFGDSVRREFKGDLFFPGLTGYTFSVLHAVAREAIDNFGALMVLTDAVILPQNRALDYVDFLQGYWGLTSVVKYEGPGALYQQGVYQVGRKSTVNAPRRWTDAPRWEYTSEGGSVREHVCNSTPFSNLLDIDTFWLRKQRKTLLDRNLGTGSFS